MIVFNTDTKSASNTNNHGLALKATKGFKEALLSLPQLSLSIWGTGIQSTDDPRVKCTKNMTHKMKLHSNVTVGGGQ